MATYRNKSGLKLTGFDELLEKLVAANKEIDKTVTDCFEKASDNLYDEMYTKAEEAGLPQSLLYELNHDEMEKPALNIWRAEVGWKKTKPSTGNPLPTFYKVMFYNYGTPSRRRTKQGGQRVQIGGKWVTLGTDRGTESAHPAGSHGFIKKAKIAVQKKNQALFKQTLREIIGDIKK